MLHGTVQPAVDPTKLSAPAQRILDPASPAPLRQMAARGIAPGLKPAEALTVVALIAESPDAALAKAAQDTLAKLPAPLLQGALGPDLPAGVLDVLAPTYLGDLAVMERLLALPQIAPDTVAALASRCSEAVAEIIATNEERMLAHPVIIEKLYLNKHTRMSTANRALELAVRNRIVVEGIPAYEEAAAALANELIPEASPEPTFGDVLFKETTELGEKLAAEAVAGDTHETDEQTGEDKVKSKFVPVHARISEMSMSEKIRTAMVGSASERAILVRDANKVVARAAVKSPQIQENEAVRIAMMRNVSDEVLMEIARSPKWKSSYQIKLNLVQNPRTPMHIASKLIPYLFEHDVKAIAKSKNVSGPIATAAKQQLQRKGKG
jgi:hypothetical protein